MSANARCGCGLAACGCCAGVENVTPRPIENRPGLSALAVRAGRHGDFLASMLARLSSHSLANGGRPLAALRTRDLNDPAIALLDAFAVAGDVLSFYNERIANEGYLRTALEFRSVEELARLVGYAPNPGVAASVFLAFGIDPNTIGPVEIAKGTRVQSVPGQDELPQSFETSEPLLARAAWNRIGLRKQQPQLLREKTDTLYLAGTATRLKPGDALLLELKEDQTPRPRRVLEVIPDVAADRTLVLIEPWTGLPVNDSRLAELMAEGKRLGGEIVTEILRELTRFQSAPSGNISANANALLTLVQKKLALPGLRANPRHRRWLSRVAARLEALATATDPADVESTDTFTDRFASLAMPPAAAPASAARLQKKTGDSFGARSSAALQVIGAAAPGVGDLLPDALAGHNAAAPRQVARVYAMRLRAGLFGRAFPKRTAALRAGESGSTVVEIGEWPICTEVNDRIVNEKEKTDVVTLDAAHDGIVPGSWVMIDMRGLLDGAAELRVAPTDEILIARVKAVDPKVARADYGGSGDTTALHLPANVPWIRFNPRGTPSDTTPPDAGDTVGASALRSMALILARLGLVDPRVQELVDREFRLIRRTTVYAEPEELALAERPITEDFCVHGTESIELDGLYAGLEPGRYVIVSGERTDIVDTEGVLASEVAMIAGVSHDVHRVPEGDGERALPGDRMHSFVTLGGKLNYCFRRDTVAIHGNVVKATHGETRAEPLGNGDARIANAAFALKQAPLTYLPAPTARGAAPALEVFVDDIRWHLVETLVDAAPTDRAYILRGGEGGKAEIQFGDGREGARPTTGVQNLRAVYRTGIGRPGNARAGQISQLSSRPLGLRDVVNPLPATGGADAESLDQLRRNAPLATMALERIVSVRDHADFARTFAGIAKADARQLTDGARRLVHLTVAAEDDAPLDETSDLVIALRQALARLGDPFSPALVAPRELRLLIVAAAIRIDPDRVWEKIVAEVRADLLDRFGFDRRDLGQGIAASALVAAIQRVPGVAHVDLDTFGGIPTMTGAPGERSPLPPEQIEDEIGKIADKVQDWSTAQPARFEGRGFLPAELLILSPDVPATLILNQRD